MHPFKNIEWNKYETILENSFGAVNNKHTNSCYEQPIKQEQEIFPKLNIQGLLRDEQIKLNQNR